MLWIGKIGSGSILLDFGDRGGASIPQSEGSTDGNIV